MNKQSIVGMLATLMLAASPLASAQNGSENLATLGKTAGKVMVDRGTGYVSATPSTQLKKGDRVITLASSGAEIVFNDGCKAVLKENNLIEISDAGCKAAIALVGGHAPAVPVASNRSYIAGALLAGGVVFAATSGHSSDNKPISGQ